MTTAWLLVAAGFLLAYANGANDNFKGVATLYGSGALSYRQALAWATLATLAGSLAATALAGGLVAVFSGKGLVPDALTAHPAFLLAVALGAALTVMGAALVGLPISTTHALTGALVGAGVTAAGFGQVRFAVLGSGVVLPLLFSPLIALVLTLMAYPLVIRVGRLAGNRDCLCVDQPQAVAIAAASSAFSTEAVLPVAPAMRWAPAAECETGAEAARFLIADGLHWFSGAAISFARGLNDTPKIAAVLLVAAAGAVKLDFMLVALAMAVGGVLGAARVAQTMSQKITPMAAPEAISANLVAAGLVTLATYFALPVSTTHVTSGGIFGIGVLRRGQADWQRVRDILLDMARTWTRLALEAEGWIRDNFPKSRLAKKDATKDRFGSLVRNPSRPLDQQ